MLTATVSTQAQPQARQAQRAMGTTTPPLASMTRTRPTAHLLLRMVLLERMTSTPAAQIMTPPSHTAQARMTQLQDSIQIQHRLTPTQAHTRLVSMPQGTAGSSMQQLSTV